MPHHICICCSGAQGGKYAAGALVLATKLGGKVPLNFTYDVHPRMVLVDVGVNTSDTSLDCSLKFLGASSRKVDVHVRFGFDFPTEVIIGSVYLTPARHQMIWCR